MSLNNARHVVLGSLVTTPPAPVVLPDHTIRCKFSSGYTPTMGDTQTLVDEGTNTWDIYKSSDEWDSLFEWVTELVEVVAANTTGVVHMPSMFSYCTSLTTVPLFDTSSATYLPGMFNGCTSLTAIPLFDTSSAQNMGGMFNGCTSLTAIPLFDTGSTHDIGLMFRNCTAVQSGALALYQQASTQANPPTSYDLCFTNCGANTVTGAAELAQIPASWGGTGA